MWSVGIEMKFEIAKINNRYFEIQDYIDPTNILNFAQNCTKQEWIEFQATRNHYSDEYNVLHKSLMMLVEEVTPLEIAEAYSEGCRLLQRNLSAYMGHNFVDSYIPVMSIAIWDNHFHTSWIFLQVLADNIGKEAQPLIEYAIDFEATQETALNLIRQLKLYELEDKVRIIANQTENYNQDYAKVILEKLSEK